MVVMPGSAMDLCREAVRQGNCLLDYLKEHARGETTIVFVRRKQDPDANFVTMEIRDQVIEQVFAQFNALKTLWICIGKGSGRLLPVIPTRASSEPARPGVRLSPGKTKTPRKESLSTRRTGSRLGSMRKNLMCMGISVSTGWTHIRR